MFSLPNIKALSERAAKAREFVRKSKTLKCDACNIEFPKAAEGRFVEETFGPFNDKPEGLIVICPACAKAHEERTGEMEPWDRDAYFRCEDCGKLHVTNYSWEIYRVVTEDGEELCRSCAGERAAKPENPAWLHNSAEVEAVTASVETLQAYKPKHLTCIGGHELPAGLVSFRETPEFEAAGLNWFSKMECGGWEGTGGLCAEVRECCAAALKHYKKCMIIVGEAGQFQVYLDIVVKAGDARKRKAKA